MLNNMQIVFGVCEAENGHGFSLGERAAHGKLIRATVG